MDTSPLISPIASHGNTIHACIQKTVLKAHLISPSLRPPASSPGSRTAWRIFSRFPYCKKITEKKIFPPDFFSRHFAEKSNKYLWRQTMFTRRNRLSPCSAAATCEGIQGSAANIWVAVRCRAPPAGWVEEQRATKEAELCLSGEKGMQILYMFHCCKCFVTPLYAVVWFNLQQCIIFYKIIVCLWSCCVRITHLEKGNGPVLPGTLFIHSSRDTKSKSEK